MLRRQSFYFSLHLLVKQLHANGVLDLLEGIRCSLAIGYLVYLIGTVHLVRLAHLANLELEHTVADLLRQTSVGKEANISLAGSTRFVGRYLGSEIAKVATVGELFNNFLRLFFISNNNLADTDFFTVLELAGVLVVEVAHVLVVDLDLADHLVLQIGSDQELTLHVLYLALQFGILVELLLDRFIKDDFTIDHALKHGLLALPLRNKLFC